MIGNFLAPAGWPAPGILALLLTLLVAAAGCDRQSDTEEGPVTSPSPGEQVYNRSCATCHESGVAEAPVTGARHAWAPRLARGRETLVRHAIEGIGAMPPRGGNPDLSDTEIRAAVDYILRHSP